jgi:ribosome-associated heat shock protein Hsp15
MSESIRIDKWLWAARFFKTRSLASNAVDLGRILHNEVKVKPARLIKVGDIIQVQKDDVEWTIEVMRILENRGNAAIAQTMYEETSDSVKARLLSAEKRKFEPEPSAQTGRPSKQHRRQLISIREEF